MNRWIVIGVAILGLAGLLAAAPAVMEKLNARALQDLNAGNTTAAVRTFERLARLGSNDAKNNLAVIRIRGLDGFRDREGGMALLAAAADEGHGVAGYNLARLTTTRRDTPLAEVRTTLDYLTPLVDQGDPHAAAEMTRHLRFNENGSVVENLSERRLALFAQAAGSDDPVYQYLYARALWDASNRDDTAVMTQAVEIMLAAAEAGEPRAMLHMGSMHWQSPRSFRETFEGGYPGGDRFDWWAKAAEAGEPSGACRFAVNWFRTISRRTTPLLVHRGSPPQIDARTRLGLSYLEECASFEGRERRSNPVFGTPALYLGRGLGGFSSEKSSAATAQTILALLHLEGRLLPADPARARSLLETAAPRNSNAEAILTALE